MAHPLHIFEDPDGRRQSIPVDEQGLGRDDLFADIGARTEPAIVAQIGKSPEFLSGNGLPGFLFPVPQTIDFGKEKAAGVHDVPAAVTIGAEVNDPTHPVFGIVSFDRVGIVGLGHVGNTGSGFT